MHHLSRDHHPPRRLRRVALLGTLVAGLLLLLTAAPQGTPAPAASAAGAVIYPLQYDQDVADPSVVQARGRRLVVVATGPQVVRGTSSTGRGWRIIDSALVTRPAWADPDPAVDIWAADMARVRGRWVLYYAVPVAGLAPSSRCIGVAVAGRPTGTFRPVGSRPLVCPPGTDAPAAEDPVLDGGATTPALPAIGAIDPSLFRDASGTYLLYKTDGRPSSIRILPLSRDGLHAGGRSRLLLASSGVRENPVMMRRGRWYTLVLSAGDYTRCSYATVFRRSRRLMSWGRASEHTLMSAADTGLCGPGGADLLVRRTGGSQEVSLYFHGWVCDGTGRPCREPFHAYRGAEDARHPVRALYGTRLAFDKRGVPHRGTWIRKRH